MTNWKASKYPIKCPTAECGRQVAKITLMDAATTVLTRTCPKCETKWRIVIRPLKVNDKMHMDQIDWKPMS